MEMYLQRWLKHWGVIGGRQLRLPGEQVPTYPGYLQPYATERGDGFYWLLLAPQSHVFRSRFSSRWPDSSHEVIFLTKRSIIWDTRCYLQRLRLTFRSKINELKTVRPCDIQKHSHRSHVGATWNCRFQTEDQRG